MDDDRGCLGGTIGLSWVRALSWVAHWLVGKVGLWVGWAGWASWFVGWPLLNGLVGWVVWAILAGCGRVWIMFVGRVRFS